ncbi:phosphohistidine phosphatase [Rhodoblastus acidophilus]|uniref:SixA phosphatase family protein n=1 Tax=Rhodoblastus acidophilus TaxID=1074 RepID=UPI002224FE51|nr:histidine phosphatase family protein [Rhodoblastus acidophilus]MCW2285077.1 phosphohistidine phosphatase [Rhodoblastus acidophilus]MCW2334065.1 phosphohistidine phosphatase [Rhodoblastus acidophilus]
MTRQLYLLRHAKSSWDEPDLSDHDRPLAKRGRKAGALLRKFFKARSIRFDAILVSSAKRAQETLAALELDAPAETLPALYHAAPDAILDILRAAPEQAERLLVIGHNPGLHDFALLLCATRGDEPARRMAESYPTGALAQFEVDRPWTRLELGCGKLTGFVTPRELKD